jgi:hypothetical protein
MSPYTRLQTQLIALLNNLLKQNPDALTTLVKECREDTYKTFVGWIYELSVHDQSLMGWVREWPARYWHEVSIPKLVLEQIKEDDGTITILNLLGGPLYRDSSYDLETWVKKRGSGANYLRTETYAQPGALVTGDILVTGDRVLSEPREGGNGSVLIKVGSENHNCWLSLPARTAVALLPPSYKPPANLVE